MNVAAHQKKKQNVNKAKREAAEEEKNSRLILERPNTALLRLFKRQHDEKWFA